MSTVRLQSVLLRQARRAGNLGSAKLWPRNRIAQGNINRGVVDMQYRCPLAPEDVQYEHVFLH